MYKVFGMSLSGNCYKVQLLLKQLGIDFQWQEINVLSGETRTAEFLKINPNGKVPTLQITESQYLPESNAILCYLADETLQWLFFEQYSHEPYIAVARFIQKFLPDDHPRRSELPRLQKQGYQALQIMEQHLSHALFFVDNTYSIADIALYAYTDVAHEGGFNLASFPAISAWMQRVQQQPGYIEIGLTPHAS
jgi:glutathione S-transferase